MQTERQVPFFGLTVKTIVVHTVTYFIMGLLALNILEDKATFEAPITRELMRLADELSPHREVEADGKGIMILPKGV